MATLENALVLAATHHAGQVDKAGQPYILHPIRLMLSVKTDEERIAAVLHDTVEDTSLTFDDLAEAGFSSSVIEAVRALTKKKGESRVDAARRAANNPIAMQVKLADVADNMDLSRLPDPKKRDLERLEEYKLVLEILRSGPEE